jgi:maleylacetoacetate isomerase/maleylpyruvate isomerase
MRLFGFQHSLATYRVRVVMALKGLHAEDVSIDLMKGEQHDESYVTVNPQHVVPSLMLEDDGPPLFQSLAIMEYLDETYPHPPLLPASPRERAHVRALALIVVADGHPLITPRVTTFLEKEHLQDGSARRRWMEHWTMSALAALERHLQRTTTGRYCHGDAVTLADVCLVSQVIGAVGFFQCDMRAAPTVMAIYEECMRLEAFAQTPAPHIR